MPCEEEEFVVLRWTDQSHVFARLMEMLREKEVFADVTLYCGRRRFAAHKFILSTCSAYLERMLRETGNEPVTFVLADTAPQTVEALLDFMYLGRVDLSPHHLDPLLDLAHDLRIRGLITPKYDLHAEEVREAIRMEREERKRAEEARKMEEERKIDEEARMREDKEKEEKEQKENENEEMKEIEQDKEGKEKQDGKKEEDKMMREAEEKEALAKSASLRKRGESWELREVRIKDHSRNEDSIKEKELKDELIKKPTQESSQVGENGETNIGEIPGRQAESQAQESSQVGENGKTNIREIPGKQAESHKADMKQEKENNDGIRKDAKRSKQETPLHQHQKFSCKHCPRSFQTLHGLNMHAISHLEKRLLSCPECPFRSLNRDALMTHIRKHASIKPYVCPYCRTRHTFEKSHITHQRNMHPNHPVVIRMAEPIAAGTYKRKAPPSEPVKPAKRRIPPHDLIKPSRVVIHDIAAKVDTKLYSPSPSPTHNVLNSPNSSSPSSPSSSGMYQFSITSPSTSPVPTIQPQPSLLEPSPSPPSTSQPSPSGGGYLAATPMLAASPPPLPRTQPCYVQLIRESSPSTLSSESDSKSCSQNLSSLKNKRVKKLSKATPKPRSSKSHTESPASQEKSRRGRNSSKSEDPLRANTSSPCPSIISVSSEQSQTPSPQPVPRKKVKKDQSSVNRAKNIVRHSREK